MFIENVVSILAEMAYGDLFRRDSWTQDFIVNVNEHVLRDSSLSTGQAEIVSKILANNKYDLIKRSVFTGAQIDSFIRSPKYRKPLYQSANIPKEVRFVGNNLLGFRFKKNAHLASELKKVGIVKFAYPQMIWLLQVTTDNVSNVVEFIGGNDFDFDDDVLQLLAEFETKLPTTCDLSDGMLVVSTQSPILAWSISTLPGAEAV